MPSMKASENESRVGAMGRVRGVRKPMRATLPGCCARTSHGQAMAATPTRPMNSRRFITAPLWPDVSLRHRPRADIGRDHGRIVQHVYSGPDAERAAIIENMQTVGKIGD